MTNLEKIRLLNAESIAKLIDLKYSCEMCVCGDKNCDLVDTCQEGILIWLNEEVKDNE